MSKAPQFGRRHFDHRRPARTAQQLRGDWVAAIGLAGSLAAEAEAAGFEGARGSPGADLTRLTVTLRDLEPGNFPVDAESARTMAAAFLKLARDFCHPAWSGPARTACAPFLKAGAGCLDGLMAALRSTEARQWRGHAGERED